jgi:hypothetical protein
MARTFSLAQLMLGVTLVCLACGCAVIFPYEYRIEVFAFYPTLVPALILLYFAKCPALSLCFTLLGYFYGFATLPTIETMARSLRFAEPVKTADAAYYMMPGLLAFIAANGYLFVEWCLLRLKNKQPQLQAECLQSIE